VRICEEIGMEKLGHPVVVDIQNVVDYMLASEEQGKEWRAAADFPTWLSPWTWAAYEWRAKTRRYCTLVETTENESGGYSAEALLYEVAQHSRPSCWQIRLQYNMGRDGGGETGQEIVAEISASRAESLERSGFSLARLFATHYMVLLTNSFLACKNVKTHDVAPHPKLAKAQLKKRGVPKITYKVLDIGPAKEVLRTEGDIEHNGLQKALHICRGHFAHYGPDAPLFGKYTGAFWHPMHTRGSAKNGIVMKDYRVTSLQAPVQKS